jgi:hypothetical protein
LIDFLKISRKVVFRVVRLELPEVALRVAHSWLGVSSPGLLIMEYEEVAGEIGIFTNGNVIGTCLKDEPEFAVKPE